MLTYYSWRLKMHQEWNMPWAIQEKIWHKKHLWWKLVFVNFYINKLKSDDSFITLSGPSHYLFHWTLHLKKSLEFFSIYWYLIRNVDVSAELFFILTKCNSSYSGRKTGCWVRVLVLMPLKRVSVLLLIIINNSYSYVAPEGCMDYDV